MKRTKMKTLFTLFFAVMASAMISCAPSEYAYDSWNLDSNDYLDNDEFETAWTDIGYYDDWDLDNDSYLTEDEWNTGVGEYFGAYDTADYGVFDDWDTNADGMLDNDEFGVGLYGVVDQNDNDLIEENEYDMWYDDDFGV